MQRAAGFSLGLISFYIIGSILVSGQSILIPFLIALIIAYLLIALAEGFRNGKRIPLGMAYGLAFIFIGVILYGIGYIITNNIYRLIETLPFYQQRMEGFLQELLTKLHMSPETLVESLKQFDLRNLFGQVALMLKDIAGRTGIITVYVFFMLIEYHYLQDKLAALFTSKKGQASVQNIMETIGAKIKSYLRLKTLISFLTALLSYGLMLFVGLDFAEFWALLIFLLNFIPTIGSIVACVFPCLFSLLQFDAWLPFWIVSVGLISLQFFMGNFVESRLMGREFNLSGLAIILALAIFGQLWGIIGMLLCVPLLMILTIILANFEQTRPLAVLLSQKGNVEWN